MFRFAFRPELLKFLKLLGREDRLELLGSILSDRMDLLLLLFPGNTGIGPDRFGAFFGLLQNRVYLFFLFFTEVQLPHELATFAALSSRRSGIASVCRLRNQVAR